MEENTEGSDETNYKSIQTILSHRRPLSTRYCSRNVKNLIQIPLERKPILPKFKCQTKFAVPNARSIGKKLSLLCDLIMSNHLDILAVTFTWLNGTNNSSWVQSNKQQQ